VLVATGAITRAIGDEATKQMGPAGADAAAAALEAAKQLRETAANQQLKIAAGVRTWRDIEQRVIEDPRGGMRAVAALSSKDTIGGGTQWTVLSVPSLHSWNGEDDNERHSAWKPNVP
jgi:hypothetical protein